jgi:hypothetical protein
MDGIGWLAKNSSTSLAFSREANCTTGKQKGKKNGIIIEHSIIIMNPTYQNARISSLLRKWNKAYREGAGDKPVRQLH